VLAQLEELPQVVRTWLSADGNQLLVEGSLDADPDALVVEVAQLLLDAEFEVAPLGPDQTQAAHLARDDPEAWLGRDDLWRLSMHEANVMVDRAWPRLGLILGAPLAPAAREPLVEHVFEGIRPPLGYSPPPRSWAPGTPPDQRAAVIVEASGLSGDTAQDLRSILTSEDLWGFVETWWAAPDGSADPFYEE
jgi:hypothetical protein